MMFIEKLPKKATLSLGKIDEYEYLTGEEILLSNQKQIIEQIFWKTNQNNWRSRKKTSGCIKKFKT